MALSGCCSEIVAGCVDLRVLCEEGTGTHFCRGKPSSEEAREERKYSWLRTPLPFLLCPLSHLCKCFYFWLSCSIDLLPHFLPVLHMVWVTVANHSFLHLNANKNSLIVLKFNFVFCSAFWKCEAWFLILGITLLWKNCQLGVSCLPEKHRGLVLLTELDIQISLENATSLYVLALGALNRECHCLWGLVSAPQPCSFTLWILLLNEQKLLLACLLFFPVLFF